MEPWSFWLRVPPSVNNLFASVRNRRVPSRAYRIWKGNAGWDLQLARPPRFAGPVTLDMQFRFADRRRRDLDNYAKAVMDLLVTHKVIAADDTRFVRGIRLSEGGETPGVRITITPVAGEVAA